MDASTLRFLEENKMLAPLQDQRRCFENLIFSERKKIPLKDIDVVVKRRTTVNIDQLPQFGPQSDGEEQQIMRQDDAAAS